LGSKIAGVDYQTLLEAVFFSLLGVREDPIKATKKLLAEDLFITVQVAHTFPLRFSQKVKSFSLLILHR